VITQGVTENWLTGSSTTTVCWDYPRKRSEKNLVWNAEYAPLSINSNIGFGQMTSCNHGTDGRWIRRPYVNYVKCLSFWKINHRCMFFKVFENPFTGSELEVKPSLKSIHSNVCVVVGEFTQNYLCIWSLETRRVVLYRIHYFNSYFWMLTISLLIDSQSAADVDCDKIKFDGKNWCRGTSKPESANDNIENEYLLAFSASIIPSTDPEGENVNYKNNHLSFLPHDFIDRIFFYKISEMNPIRSTSIWDTTYFHKPLGLNLLNSYCIF